MDLIKEIELLDTIIGTLLSNEMFIGFGALAVIGGVYYLLRNVPNRLFNLYLRWFTVTASIRNDTQTYDWFMIWFFKNGFHKRSKRLNCTYVHTIGSWVASPGDGNHIIFYGWKPIFITKETEEAKGNVRPQTFHVRTLGRNHDIINKILDEGKWLSENGDEKVVIHGWNRSFWGDLARKTPRSLDSIILSDNKKEDIKQDLENFFVNKRWYVNLGIPYKRGYLLYGPPGTGKSSFVFGLASHFNKKIYVLNLNDVINDSDLIEAFSEVENNSFILIEDVDTISVANTRKEEDVESNSNKSSTGITLSGLLNAMDGVASPEERVVFLSTNFKEKLDPALIRRGRIDKSVYIGHFSENDIKQFFIRFFPQEEDISEDVAKIINNFNISPATIQGIFMDYIDNPRELLYVTKKDIHKYL